jgi:hypothetical protein
MKIRIIGSGTPEEVPGNFRDDRLKYERDMAIALGRIAQQLPNCPEVVALSKAQESGKMHEISAALRDLKSVPSSLVEILDPIEAEFREAGYRQIRRQGGVK